MRTYESLLTSWIRLFVPTCISTGSSTGCRITQLHIIYSGWETTITDGTDGGMVITIQDIIPYFHFADGERSRLLPIEQLVNYT